MPIYIVLRKTEGGWQARFDIPGRRFCKVKRTQAEAVGSLVIEEGMSKAIDINMMYALDRRTQAFINGRRPPGKMSSTEIDFQNLPKVSEKMSAIALTLIELKPHIPTALFNALRRCFPEYRERANLGFICDMGEKWLIQEASPFMPIGPKRMAQVRALLAHYKLEFRK